MMAVRMGRLAALVLCVLVAATGIQTAAFAGSAQLQDQATGSAAQTITVALEYEGA